MKKLLVLAEFPAPYRVAVFEEIGKYYEIDVYFEKDTSEERSKDYFVRNATFDYWIISNSTGAYSYKETCKKLKEYDLVIVYNACTPNGVALALKCKLSGIPYVVNNDGAFIRRSIYKDFIKRFIFCNAEMCFASGKSSEEYYLHYGVNKERIRYHNFTSLRETDILKEIPSKKEKITLRNQLKLEDNATYFITVGQFIERKGFDLLLKAWNKIEKRTDVKLILIGGGSKRSEYEKYIKDNKIKNILIIDFLPKVKLFEYYKACDVFVLPTREDVWGLVINEAMACGLPIISSNMCIAARELIDKDINGFLYDVNDIDELAKYIQYFLDRPEKCLEMGRNSIEKIQGNTIENIGRRHLIELENYWLDKGIDNT